ncbi:hypothetical protein RF11_05511 [Thelohanellus kitauei]|uniref:Uncharacterized protein n=1 Tax=Thelohanellus kitauei TaxID=669202 RepID=A0A0C2MCD3_THEKT|nr:hypothetical protein RF11_05511 [Thelohanellus kitauei]
MADSQSLAEPNAIKKEMDEMNGSFEVLLKKLSYSQDSVNRIVKENEMAMESLKSELQSKVKMANELQDSFDDLVRTIKKKIENLDIILSNENIQYNVNPSDSAVFDRIYMNYDHEEIVKKRKLELKSSLDVLNYTSDIYSELFKDNCPQTL